LAGLLTIGTIGITRPSSIYNRCLIMYANLICILLHDIVPYHSSPHLRQLCAVRVLSVNVLSADVLSADVLSADVLSADVLSADVLSADVLSAVYCQLMYCQL